MKEKSAPVKWVYFSFSPSLLGFIELSTMNEVFLFYIHLHPCTWKYDVSGDVMIGGQYYAPCCWMSLIMCMVLAVVQNCSLVLDFVFSWCRVGLLFCFPIWNVYRCKWNKGIKSGSNWRVFVANPAGHSRNASRFGSVFWSPERERTWEWGLVL